MKRTIVALGLALVLTGCGAVGDAVSYEVLQPGQVTARFALDASPGAVGVAEVGGNTYAFITADANQDIEIIAVEKAEVGIDIRYRIKASDTTAPKTKVIKIRNFFSVPVGFKKVD